jgi:hypothetical protein
MVFKTDIVNTIKLSLFKKFVLILLLILSNYYIFLNDEYKNTILDIIALITYAFSFTLAVNPSIIKPKYIGKLRISNSNIKANINNNETIFKSHNIKSIYLKYSGYGSWWKNHSIYGNKNYLIIIDRDNSREKFEILIKNKEEKERLKSILNLPELGNKFDFEPIMNTKLSF